jgi:hypothetical protein
MLETLGFIKMQGSQHIPTDEISTQVFALSSFGVTQEDIGGFVGLSDDTLRKYYSEELARASIDRNSKVAAFLFTSASGEAVADGASYSDCIRAAMFWLKTRANWRETKILDNTSSDGSMTPSQPLTDAELRRELEKRGLPPTLFDE